MQVSAHLLGVLVSNKEVTDCDFTVDLAWNQVLSDHELQVENLRLVLALVFRLRNSNVSELHALYKIGSQEA